MLQGLSVRPYQEMRFACGERKRPPTARLAARQNDLLAALPTEDYERLLPNLEAVLLPLGWVVHRSHEPEKYLYFPTAGIVSRCYLMLNGASVGLALTGSEGVVGVASFLGGQSTPSQSVVVSAGYGYRLKTALVKHEFENDGPLSQLLLGYTQALITQMAQTAVCNRQHSGDQQLCRLLLLCLDRLKSNELSMTQGLIANMLGVRRESVTEAAGKLRDAKLIRYQRGRISVLDRSELETRTCECYQVVKSECDRLLPCVGG